MCELIRLLDVGVSNTIILEDLDRLLNIVIIQVSADPDDLAVLLSEFFTELASPACSKCTKSPTD